MAGLGVRIYTDEMISPALATELRKRGYDVESCHEAGRANQRINDPNQLAYAAEQGRAILTENALDFLPLDARWKRRGREHAGIICYTNIQDVGELLRRVIAHLETCTPEMQRDIVLWL